MPIWFTLPSKTRNLRGIWQMAGISGVFPLKSLPLPPIRQNNSTGAWRRVRRHLGSSIALGLGCLGVIAALPSLVHAVEDPHLATLRGDTLMGGAVMLLGALAYRSAKKRKFGEAKSTLMRYFWEITLLVPIFGVIFAVILRPNNFSYLIETKPVQNLLIAIGAIAAYVVAGIRATARPTPVVAKESFRLPRSSRAPH